MEFEEKVEKLSPTNGQLLKGADLIDDIKAKLEEQCPDIVSCADTIAFAVAESMTLGDFPPQPQPNLGGHKDSLSSRFNAGDMVALNGAHSVGAAHCSIFSERLKLVEKRKALLETDQAMANDKRTTSFVRRMAKDLNLFPMKFGEVMSRMGSLGVLTGKQGEVRTTFEK
ncbi:peroxidase 28-like [Senna tora]|uniref:peroxidase n=1 Tax=Senna tora TaxID=362788 RepID=A0A834TT87_9FABA|nr:peroxidase 28-like [Senna tora]